MKRILVTGVTGQLGHDVVFELARRRHTAIGTARRLPSELPKATTPLGLDTPAPGFVQMDLTDENAVKDTVASLRPDAVIHCAAWTAVDAAEDEENRDAV